jgi:hypothetical protein
MTQIMFPLDKAHEALDEFLNRAGSGSDAGHLIERWLAGEDGEPVAYLVPADAYDEMSNGHAHWLESQEVREEGAAPENGYKPWRHSPLANIERLLPIEPLHDPLAHGMFRKPYDELDEQQKNAVMGTAIFCLLRVTLDPDGQGAVPVLAVGHDGDEPGSGLRWQLAFVTEVPGLYVRVTANGFFGDEYGIVTGSGYRLAGGWYSREDAGSAVAALGRVLPNTDWMRLTPGAFTPRAKEAIAAVIRKYRFPADDSAPDPEPVTDEVPPVMAEVSAAAGEEAT